MKVHIRTFGCSMNWSDSEAMAGVLEGHGHVISEEGDADVIVVNTCTVKAASDRKAQSFIQKQEKPVVIAGCMVQADPSSVGGHVVIGTNALDRIAEAVDAAYLGQSVAFLEGIGDRLSLPVRRQSAVSAVIPISRGCLGSCAYCRTKLARGDLESFPSKDIVRHCRQAVDAGAKELWLTAEDTAAYGMDTDESLFALIESVSAIPGDFMIRLGMANPRHVLGNMDGFKRVFGNTKLYSFLHIPVQSGSDRILGEMLRPYSRQGFLDIVFGIRRSCPRITVCTDIICGFPGETDADFQETLSLISEASPDLLHISGYSKRPGTKAASMPSPGIKTIRHRTREAAASFSSIAKERNQAWHGWKGPVLCVAEGKEGTTIARNFAYRQVILPERIPLGEVRQAEILSSTAHYLIARTC